MASREQPAELSVRLAARISLGRKVENMRVSADIDELRRLRRARDRMDRDYAQPLDVPARPHGADVASALQPPLPRGVLRDAVLLPRPQP
jgi:hypothetical protein